MCSKLLFALIVAFASQALALNLSLLDNGSSALYCNFSVKLDKPLKSFEKLGVSGNSSFLGNWSTDAVVFLNQTNSETLWSGIVQCDKNNIVNYRYFIGVEAENGDLQVREWETHIEGRTIDIKKEDVETSDEFGVVDGVKDVHRGWLNSGYILQLKLFKNPFKLDNVDDGQKIFVKVTPVELNNTDTPITPSARAYVETFELKDGESKIKTQPDDGVAYVRDAIVMFQITTSDNENITYEITYYKENDGGEKIDLGHTYLYPEDLGGNDNFKDFEVNSPDDKLIGTINIGFLWIEPLPKNYSILNFKTTFAHYWPQEWPTLDVGHNGLGKSLKISQNAAPFIEGTVESMVAAGQHGVDMIEFDVQCTKDHYPIIFHAHEIPVAKDSSVKPTSADDITTRLIKNMTYEELKNTRIYEVVASKVDEYKSHNEESRKNWRLFPTLEDFLVNVPLSVGFDIEIKWPQWKANDQPITLTTIDKNKCINRILDMMLRKGCGRMAFFSSVDTDILTMIRYKQNMFGGVMMGFMTPDFYADPRTTTYEQLLNYANALELLGVVSHAISFDQNGEEMIKAASDQNLKVCMWGDDLGTSKSNLNKYKNKNPGCVIVDRFDKFLPDERKSFFSKGKFPEYFQRQCPADKN